jgi:G3E family GTPase
VDHTPLTVLASIDPVLRDTVIFGIAIDSPRTVVLRHDIVENELGDGGIRRVVLDATGVLQDETFPLEHACLTCAVREDALPTIRDLAADDRWDSIVLALPVSAETFPVARTIARATRRRGILRQIRLATVATVLDVTSAEKDLLEDDLLEERDLALTADDRRSVGEALAAQLGHADLIIVAGESSEFPVGSDLIEHLRASDSKRIDGLHELSVNDLMAHTHDAELAEERLHPHHVRANHGPTAHGVWSLELVSNRPFHPERLAEQVARLGSGRIRSRGVFWVANRPGSACAWDGAGGQLSVGDFEPWGRQEPFTRLVFTGTGDERAALTEAFEDLLLTSDEMSLGLSPWLGREDVLEPWLGERSAAW